MKTFQVIVGNIGTVYQGDDEFEAGRIYNEYVEQSNSPFGRASNEAVCIMMDGDIIQEHFPVYELEG